jgi:IgA peptidase M64/peptidase M64-like protein
MRFTRWIAAMAFGIGAASAFAAPPGFDASFTGATLRVDLYHTGTRAEESFALDGLREEGPWAGTRARLIDDTNFGNYLARVFDAGTNQLLYSRGYSSLFGEWRTTDEAKSVTRTMHESVLVPMPRGPAYVTIASRDAGNVFREIFHASVDPFSENVVRESVCPPGAFGRSLEEIAVTGDPSERLDILFVAEGYTAAEAEKFRRDARRYTRILLGTSPFSGNAGRINVRSLFAPSPESGTDEPRKGVFRATAIQTSFDTFGIERYLTAPDNRRLRDVAACAPYDRMIVLVNTSRYGGAGIHDQWAVTATDNEYGDYVTVHEFGHALAGLGDEYFSSSVAYNELYPPGVEPWEANISAMVPRGLPKWEGMLTPGVPVPTPADPERYARVVGAFEGAGYAAKGLYRPSLDCMMFSKGYAPFDPVCRAAIEAILDRESSSPSR